MKTVNPFIRRRVQLNIPIVQRLGLTWGQRLNGTYIMTREGWAKATVHGAVTRKKR